MGVGEIDPDSHTKRVDNSGSATTVLATKYLYNDANCLFLKFCLKGECFF